MCITGLIQGLVEYQCHVRRRQLVSRANADNTDTLLNTYPTIPHHAPSTHSPPRPPPSPLNSIRRIPRCRARPRQSPSPPSPGPARASREGSGGSRRARCTSHDNNHHMAYRHRDRHCLGAPYWWTSTVRTFRRAPYSGLIIAPISE